MTIRELTECYYPNKTKMNKIALHEFCNTFCEHPTHVYNALLRNGIFSIRDLHEASEEQIASIRTFGTKRVDEVMKIKRIIMKLLEQDRNENFMVLRDGRIFSK